MPFLNLDGGSGSDHIVEKLVLERTRRAVEGVGFDAVDVNEAILQAAVLLFRDRQQQHQAGFSITAGRHSRKQSSAVNNIGNEVKLEKLCINNCPANPFLEYLIEASMGMDLFREFELQGHIEEEDEQTTAQQIRQQTSEINDDNGNNVHLENSPQTSNVFALDALGFRMRFSKRLRKVELINLPITRDHAESLMYGIETNDVTGTGCRLDTLVMDGVRFVDLIDQEEDSNVGNESGDGERAVCAASGDGTVVVKEFSEGFPNNRTLQTIKIERCKLTDSQMAMIFDSLARHPTLKHLNLSENSCRELGLEALDRMLVMPSLWMSSRGDITIHQNCCKLESLDLSYQFTSEDTYGTIEHIQLGLLTKHCAAERDTDSRMYPYLRKLVLQGNQIDDSDMKDLAFLIRHRFPCLEELDLRFNEITTQGLEMFVNLTDPNNLSLNMSTNKGLMNVSDRHNCLDKDFESKERRNNFPSPRSRLRTIRLTNNPLVMSNQTSIVILKLLKIHPELQLIQSNLEWADGTPIAKYIQHLLDINRAGRVLLLAGISDSKGKVATQYGKIEEKSSSNRIPESISCPLRQGDESASLVSNITLHPEKDIHQREQLRMERRSIPLGAWPIVLARLTRKSRYPHYVPLENCLNGMYYLIRHGPIILEEMASRKDESTAKNTGTRSLQRRKHSTKETYRKRKWGDPALGGYETLTDFLDYELGSNC